MTGSHPPNSPEEPTADQWESEQDSDSQGDATPQEGADEAITAEEAHQRAGAKAAYGMKPPRSPRKHAPEAGSPAPDEDVVESSDEESEAGQTDAETEVVDEIAAKAERADEYLALAQRTQADFENFRKRAARDAALAQERGIAKLAKELLPAVDNLERAVHHAGQTYGSASGPAGPDAGETGSADPTDSQIVDGLKLVHAELLAALARAGIEPFSPVGEQFDPQHHEAVAQHHVEGVATGTVLEVYQQGYRLGETVLRPARVLVAS